MFINILIIVRVKKYNHCIKIIYLDQRIFSNYNFLILETVNSNMKVQNEDDGWDQTDTQQQTPIQNQLGEPYFHNYRSIKDRPRQILTEHHHSLQPDMVLGWKPKLPSCPLPLSYSNPYVDCLLKHLPNDDRFKVVFLGPRYVNSVQMNQQYDYTWKYRTRYSLNVAIVKEAVRNVGVNNNRSINLEKGEYDFDSSFESGNLDMAVRVKKNQYDLFLRSDTNTRGHTSWYYFKISNSDRLGQVQLNICNFGKNKNLYNKGMKPYVLIDGQKQWLQEHTYDVMFVQRLCRYGFDRKSFQLQFKYNFTQKNKTVYFAYSIPYTYSRLQKFIQEIVTDHPKLIKSKKICQSLGGINVPLLTITNAGEGEQNIDHNQYTLQPKKKAILVTARIHPGQSHSSHLTQGFIRYILSQQPEAQALLKSFVFYIVPMLNPDGVIAGNFRTSFSGKDLNRQFDKLNKYIFPEITALHDLALSLKRNYRSGLQFYLDFHGHSSKKGLFCYGPQHPTAKLQFFKCRALAKIIQQKNSIFSYRKSIFTISENKKSTSRAHMLWKIKIPMSFTFQVSNGLYETRDIKCIGLTQQTLDHLGQDVVKGLFRYAQLEMKLPGLNAKAKIDTGIHSKRVINSSKSIRKSSAGLKGKIISLKQIDNQKNIASGIFREKGQSSMNNIVEKCEQKQQLMKLMKEIKRQSCEKIENVDQYQGGSDSESENDDLSTEELQRLYRVIQTRNEPTKKYSKGSLNWRLNQDKSQLIKKSTELIEQATVEQIQIRKPASSKYLDGIKYNLPPKNLKRIQLIESQKIALPQKNFTIDL